MDCVFLTGSLDGVGGMDVGRVGGVRVGAVDGTDASFASEYLLTTILLSRKIESIVMRSVKCAFAQSN